MRNFLPAALLSLSVFIANAQTPIVDSIRQQLAHSGDDKTRLKNLLALMDRSHSMPADSAWNYVIQTRSLALKERNDSAFSLATIAEAGVYLRWGHTDSARALIEPELAKYKVENAATREVYFSLAQAQVDCVDHNDNYKDAMPLLFSVLKDAEFYKDSPVIANCMNTMAAWKYDLDFLPESRSWSYRALEHCVPGDPRFTELYIGIYSVLGDNYRWIKQLDSAAWCLFRAEDLCRKSGNLYWLSGNMQRLCGLYMYRKEYDKAEGAIRESFRLGEQVEGKVPQQEKWMFLAAVFERSGKLDQAIAAMKEGLSQDTLYRNHSPRVKKDNGETDLAAVNYYSELARCYRLKGDYKSYSEIQEKIIDGYNSFYKINTANSIAGYQTRYEVEKKEATIARQQLTLLRDRYFFWGTIGVSVLASVIILLIFQDSRRRHKVKMQLLREEEKRLASTAVSEAEEHERKRIAADLHDNLGAQLSFIKRNVNFIMEQPDGFSHTDEKRYLGYVNDIAQSAMIDLRETLWVLNKDQVTIQEFGDKLKSYLRQQLLDKDQIVWEFQEHIAENWTLSSGEVMHLFRIVQELVSNIIKHAGADRIDIGFTSPEPGGYQLTIADNGSGFEVNAVNQGHYGLENIRQRAKDIGASLQVESLTGRGTTVILTKKK